MTNSFRVLLLGGSGFLSGSVARLAAVEGNEVMIVTRGRRPVPPGVATIVADRQDRPAFTRALAAQREDWDLVIDGIAYTPEDAEQDIVTFANRTARLVFVSTDFVYDPLRRRNLQNEHEAAYATEGYGGQKRAAERVLSETAPSSLPWTILRPAHIYGPGAPLGCLPLHGRDPELVGHILARRPLRLVAGGTYLQQPLLVTDLAQTILDVGLAPSAVGRVLNVAGPEVVTARSYYETLGHLLDREVEIESVPESSFLTDHPDKAPFCCDRVYDLTSLCDTGVAPPSTPLEDGFRQFLAAMHPGIKHLLISAAAALAACTANAGPVRAEPLPFVLDMVHHNPGEPLFVTKFNDPAFLKKWGYTGQCPKFFTQTAVTYEAFDPTVTPKGSDARAWSEKTAAFIDERIAEAQAASLPLYPFTDVLLVPKTLMEKYGGEMKTDGHLSILRPMTQKVLRAQIAEIFERFPGLSGLTIRFGETHLHDTPYHVGESPAASIEEQKALIALLREEICVKRDKQLIYRSWSWGGIGLHTNPTTYLDVTDAIEPHPKLAISIKHASGDFVRGVPFNRTLGIGKHPQIVEVSANQAGLFGKGAHPYYLGQGVIDGWEEMGEGKRGLRDLVASKQFVGVWTWTAGDGWGGPYSPNEFWTNLNAWVIKQFGLQPWRTEPELFAEYARDVLKLDEAQTQIFRELCLLSASAAFHGQQSSLLSIRPFWCRDDFLAAVNLEAVVAQNISREVLEEKATAVADWRRIEALSRKLHLPNPADQDFLEVSATYGRIKYALIERIWKMQILAAEGKRDGKLDTEGLRAALDEYDALWKEWRQLKADHASCPTLYKEEKSGAWGAPPGMKETLHDYRAAVSAAGVGVKPE